MNYDEYNDYELVYFVKEDNEEASEILYNKYAPIIMNYSTSYYKYIKNTGLEINDLVQEGMLGLNNAINTFSEDKNVLFYTYAVTCIKRAIVTSIIRANRQKNRPLNNSLSFELNDEIQENEKLLHDNSYNPEYIIEENESREDLYKVAKKELTEFELKVFDLKLNNFTYSEISELLNRPYKSIDNALRRIKTKLKKALDEKDN